MRGFHRVVFAGLLIAAMVGFLSASATQAAQNQDGYVGPFEDGCSYYWSTAQQGYTSRACPQYDGSFHMYAAGATGNWEFVEAGFWLDDLTYQPLSDAGYYGPFRGCAYFWNGAGFEHSFCPRTDGYFDYYLYVSQGEWQNLGYGQYLADNSLEMLGLNGVYVRIFTDGSSITLYPDGKYVTMDRAGNVLQEGVTGSNQGLNNPVDPRYPLCSAETQAQLTDMEKYLVCRDTSDADVAGIQRVWEPVNESTDVWTEPYDDDD